LILHSGDAVAVETPGAGGYGSPKERSREMPVEDLYSEKFTRRYIEDHYGPDMLAS
jgi:N-methylhydantoinase B